MPIPKPGPGQVRLRVTAAGLCHSDWSAMDLPADKYTYGPPLRLSHKALGSSTRLGTASPASR